MTTEPPAQPDAEPAREPGEDRSRPRGSLLGLLVPVGILVAALAGWTWWWFTVAHAVERGVDKLSVDLTNAGYRVAWKTRSVSGWPFRTVVRFQDLRIAAPSGHAFHAPKLHAGANTYALERWIAVAPDGFTFVRGEKGAVEVKGEALRASLSQPRAHPPRIVIELNKPVFTAAPAAEPFPLASAELVQFNLEAREGGKGAFLLQVNGGKPRPDGMLDWIGSGEPFTTRWEGLITRPEAFDGGGWTAAARNWTRAGGVLQQVRVRAETGPASVQAYAPQLSVGTDGRLRGSVDLSLAGGPQSLLAMARAHAIDPAGAAVAATATSLAGGLNGTVKARLDFEADGARLGPARLSDSPRVY